MSREQHVRPSRLDGARVVSLESRRATELCRLIEKLGGVAHSAPSMAEIPLSDQEEALAFGRALLAGECDIALLLTGVGTKLLFDTLSAAFSVEALRAALGACFVGCRGPKAAATARAIGVIPDAIAPEPNTWRELLSELERTRDVDGARVFIQEYGAPNEDLERALASKGARVRRVPVYKWQLPPDIEPLKSAILAVCDRHIDAVLFTSGHQVVNLFELARRLDVETQLRQQLAGTTVGSVGPVTSEALRRHGVEPSFEPAHPKMGHLVQELARFRQHP